MNWLKDRLRKQPIPPAEPDKLRIHRGKPLTAGVHLAYVDADMPSRFASTQLLMWDGQRWFYCLSDQKYRGAVHGWIGPIPPLRLKE